MDKWNLGLLYKDEEAFENDLEKAKGLLPEFAALKGKLNTEAGFGKYLDLNREVELLVNRLYMFAGHRSDLNKKDVKNAEAEAKVVNFLNDLNSASSFAEPEILSGGKQFVDGFFKSHPDYGEFDFAFEKLFRGQKHVLDARSEGLLSYYAPLNDASGNLYSTLSIADAVPNKVTLSTGEEVTVTQSSWVPLLSKAADPSDRKAIFEALYKNYDASKNTYGEIYATGLKAQLANMKARGYQSILESHLFNNDIPAKVYTTLIEAAHEGSGQLKRYYEMRRKYLGLEKHRSYDRFLELAKSDRKYTYEEAKEMFFNSLGHFPEDFRNKAREVLKEGYVDVYPGEGKKSGAYSSGGGNIHPFILLNFSGTLDDCFTVAHESGHSIHTLYSMEAQPLMKSNYTIFVAEIASTFNEHNLLDYLLAGGKLTREEQIMLLQKEIDEICGTFFRQTLFGEYELIMAKKAEAGEPLNYAVMSDVMVDLYRNYYGIDIREEVYKPLVWAYIPHLFYTPFYVYQYATSFTASMLLYSRVKSEEPGAFDRYLGLLRAGGSDYPVNEVKAAGVDLTDVGSYRAVTSRMKELLDKLETLLFPEGK